MKPISSAYGAKNNVTGFKMVANETMSLAFDFRDWKYLSGHIRKSVTIKDADIIVGNKEGEIEVDFAKATNSDAKNKTQYIVGGRLFWETHVFGNYFVSYTTNGFFDQKDYKEP